ncbi:MAG: formylglycine-generating enzyme family protein [Candidatus Poseidoniaceae archaeon]|nr:formylglycine-generating enzyme family protein [Candidatus Poseidoniaceae archaeon]
MSDRMAEVRPSFTTEFGGTFVLIETGIFRMGSETRESSPNEGPTRQVEIAQPFFISVRPLTQAEWVMVMGSNPSKFSEGIEAGLYPVESISWFDAMSFVEQLNQRFTSDYLGLSGRFRLPSESEWECAARAGSTTQWSFVGADRELSQFAWHAGNSGARTKMVGQKDPNDWGLYDVHGLVSEWCLDQWHPNYHGAPRDHSPWLDDGLDDLRVHRGGCWFHESYSCRSSSRGKARASHTSDGIGLRLVWEPLGESNG